MTPKGKKIALLEKKLDHLDNDLFKLMAKDLFKQEVGINDITYALEKLKIEYKIELHNLRLQERGKSKQIDLEDAIAEIKQSKQLTTFHRDGY